MKYVVADFEWNQGGFGQKTARVNGRVLAGEIIQIGAVRLNSHFEPEEKFKTSVRPSFYTKINPLVESVTGLRQGDINCGYRLPYIIERFRSFCGNDFVFVTWGGDDIPILRDNLAINGLPDDWVPQCYDLQEIYDDQITHESRRCALGTAAEQLKVQMHTAHDALGDAMSTVNVLHALDMEKGLAGYRPHLDAGGESYEQKDEDTATYESMDEAISACLTAAYRCPECGDLGSYSPWVRQRSDLNVNMGRCPAGHGVYVRLKLKLTRDGCRIDRRYYPLDEAREAEYNHRREKEKEKMEEAAELEAMRSAGGMWSF